MEYLIILILIIILIIIILNKKEYFNNNDNPIDNLDAVIYINLENREDRKKLLLEELTKMNIPDNKIHKVSGVYIPKNGHKGCVQSHITALNIIKMNNWNKVLILEDDAILNVSPEEFKNELIKMFNYIDNNNFDVLMLSSCYEKKNKIKDNIVKIEYSTTSSAYIVNKNYIDKLLNLFLYINSMMDNHQWTFKNNEIFALDQRWNELQKKDNWLGFEKDLIKQRKIKSSINEFA